MASILTLVTGTGLGQAALFAAYPVITRIYSVTDFGILAIFTSLLTPLIVTGSLRLEGAIPLPAFRQHAVTLATMAGFVNLSLTILVSIGAIALAPWIESYDNYRPLYPYLWMLPLAFFSGAFYRLINAWLVRLRDFRKIAAAAAVQGITIVTCQLTLGFAGIGVIGLLMGPILGPAVGIYIMTRSSIPTWLEIRRFSKTRAWALLKRYSQFPKYSAPQVTINSIGGNLPGLLFAGLFGLDVAGLYFLGHRVLRHPADLVGESFRQAFYPDLIEAEREGESKKLAIRATLIATALVSPPALIIWLFAEPVFSYVFGNEWETAGTYASVLVFMVLSSFVNIPSVSLITVLGLQRFMLITELPALGLRCGAILLGAALESDVAAVAMYSAAGIVVNLVIIAYALTRDDIQKMKSPPGTRRN
jgi:O-antigen/teichoic acid export membrane protein